jgi:ribosomal protein S19E (S16A)
MSVLLAGGGVKGGQVYGSSDKRGEYPHEKPVAPEHVARTVFHAMGVGLMASDREGRPFSLLEEGRPLTELFT